MWGCLSPFFYLFVIFSCPARALFVLGVVGKGSPPSPGKKKQKKNINLAPTIIKKSGLCVVEHCVLLRKSLLRDLFLALKSPLLPLLVAVLAIHVASTRS